MYRNLPLALIDMMLTDLPRVEFGEEKITQEDIKEARIKDQKLQERLKTGGGIGANLKNKVGSNAAFLKSKMKGGI
jgi:hypothetical protein